jgi:hypothetical protein
MFDPRKRARNRNEHLCDCHVTVTAIVEKRQEVGSKKMNRVGKLFPAVHRNLLVLLGRHLISPVQVVGILAMENLQAPTIRGRQRDRTILSISGREKALE